MKRIIIFLAVTFTLTYALEIGVVFPVLDNPELFGIPVTMTQFVVGLMMFIPAIGVLITRLVTKEGFKNSYIKPVNFRHTFKYYLMAWFGPAVLTIIGALVYFAIFPNDFDPTMSSAIATLGASMASLGESAPSTESLTLILVAQLAMGIFLSPVLNFITCFGEEWGWRGYLVPKVNEKLSFIPTVLITGVIWGLWHAPLTYLGHNYGLDYVGYPFLGIFAMCLFCIVVGTFFSYLTIRAKSCIPAVIGHGALNGFSSGVVFFSLSGGNPFIGPIPIGIIGGVGFIAAAIVICVIMNKQEKQQRDLTQAVPSLTQDVEQVSEQIPGQATG